MSIFSLQPFIADIDWVLTEAAKKKLGYRLARGCVRAGGGSPGLVATNLFLLDMDWVDEDTLLSFLKLGTGIFALAAGSVVVGVVDNEEASDEVSDVVDPADNADSDKDLMEVVDEMAAAAAWRALGAILTR